MHRIWNAARANLFGACAASRENTGARMADAVAGTGSAGVVPCTRFSSDVTTAEKTATS